MIRPRRRIRRAFTLIEMTVVIAILALLTTMATLSLGGVMDRYRLSRAAEAIEAFDARARRSARLSREGFEAIIDRRDRELTIPAADRGRRIETAQYRLPRNVEISDIRMRRKVALGQKVAIRFSDQGASPTYAVELRRGKRTRWLVVLGISGQVVAVANEGEADALLSI